MKTVIMVLSLIVLIVGQANMCRGQLLFWERWNTTGTPPLPRMGHAAAAVLPAWGRDTLVVFGGRDTSGLLNDVFLLNANHAWTRLQPAGTPPAPRAGHSAIVVSSTKRILFFGGYASGGRCVNEVWALDSLAAGGVWTLLTPRGTPPPSRAEHSAVYDSAYDRMIVYGGRDSASNPLGNLWALDSVTLGVGRWRQLTPSGTIPPARYNHSGAYDQRGRRMVVFGGRSASGALGDLYELSLTSVNGSWTLLNPGGQAPTARYGHVASFGNTIGAMWLFGGQTDSLNFFNDTYFLGGGWTRENPYNPPSPRAEMPVVSSIYSPYQGILQIIGGKSDSSLANDVWNMGSGDAVEEPAEVRGRRSEVSLTVVPNPFVSFASVPGHEKERFGLYDVSGRLVGVYRGDKIGWDSAPRVYFVRAKGETGITARVVKVR